MSVTRSHRSSASSQAERKSLIEKVREALEEACRLDPQAYIELETMEPDLITGLVLSSSFAGRTPSERQEMIWKHLDGKLTRSERMRVTFIVTDTPEEHAALQGARQTV